MFCKTFSSPPKDVFFVVVRVIKERRFFCICFHHHFVHACVCMSFDKPSILLYCTSVLVLQFGDPCSVSLRFIGFVFCLLWKKPGVYHYVSEKLSEFDLQLEGKGTSPDSQSPDPKSSLPTPSLPSGILSDNTRGFFKKFFGF